MIGPYLIYEGVMRFPDPLELKGCWVV